MMVQSSKGHRERSKDKLKNYVDSEVKKLFKGVLDYAEVAIDSKDRWKALRSRVLKLSNDAIREITKELDTHYDVSYVNPPGEDIIVINKGK